MSEQEPKDPPVAAHVLAFWQATRDFENTTYRTGFDAGWGAGWDAGVTYILEKLQKTAPPPPPPDHAVELPQSPRPLPVQTQTTPSKVSSADLVLDAIRRRPGLRGSEILDYLKAAGHVMLERTMRTALYRGKKQRIIKIVDGRWYAADAAPADPQPSLPEG